jgi:hypothetical protein
VNDFEPRSVKGIVSRGTVDSGSRSEREAVVLNTLQGDTYVLRRLGSVAFGDNSMDGLIGKTIQTDGLAKGSTLIIRDWKVLAD